MGGVSGNMWVRGTWATGHSDNTDGETAYKMEAGEWVDFYAGDLTDDVAQGWISDGDTVYSVVDGDGDYGGKLALYVQATGVVWGKIVLMDADGNTYQTLNINSPDKFDHTLPMVAGYSVHVKRSD